MQAPTHILAGVILQKVFKGQGFTPLRFVLLFLFGLFFHGIFDKLAKTTYHPPDPDFSSVFWVSYHAGILIATIAFIFVFGRPYKWGVIFSMLPDLDWVLIHGQKIFNVEISFYRVPHIHRTINYFLDHTFPFYYLNLLPDNRFNPLACLWELVLAGTLLLVIYRLIYGKSLTRQ